jgi:hypothetical protein
MGVMAGAEKILDAGGIGARNPHIWRLKKLDFAVQCPIKPNQITNGRPSPITIKFSA